MRLLILLSLPCLALAFDPMKMLCLVNQQRVNNGLKPLGYDSRLDHTARSQADWQAQHGEMTHTGTRGSDPATRISWAGINWQSVGENVAYGYDSEESCMNAWMNSPGHRENILSPDYTHVGNGCGYSNNGGTSYYAQDFYGDGKQNNFPVCPSGGSSSYGNNNGGSYGNNNGVSYGNNNGGSYGNNNGGSYGNNNGGSYGNNNGGSYGNDNGGSYGNSNGGSYGNSNGGFGGFTWQVNPNSGTHVDYSSNSDYSSPYSNGGSYSNGNSNGNGNDYSGLNVYGNSNADC